MTQRDGANATLTDGRARAGPSERLMRERAERIEQRRRNNPRWKNPPVRIEKWECIVCDACLRECPPQFGAIFNDGIDVAVIPELCSGCNRCLKVCPMDCIYPTPQWPATEEVNEGLWSYPGTGADPYINRRAFRF
jgi:electron transport complex protein RnfB